MTALRAARTAPMSGMVASAAPPAVRVVLEEERGGLEEAEAAARAVRRPGRQPFARVGLAVEGASCGAAGPERLWNAGWAGPQRTPAPQCCLPRVSRALRALIQRPACTPPKPPRNFPNSGALAVQSHYFLKSLGIFSARFKMLVVIRSIMETSNSV